MRVPDKKEKKKKKLSVRSLGTGKKKKGRGEPYSALERKRQPHRKEGGKKGTPESCARKRKETVCGGKMAHRKEKF